MNKKHQKETLLKEAASQFPQDITIGNYNLADEEAERLINSRVRPELWINVLIKALRRKRNG
ncbi:hypothetical protein [Romboutsia sp.]|uniref:hypothetical protein n=1 Tax=Romboutsia sp. TaxID=1965302 RepID=UPI003F66C59D